MPASRSLIALLVGTVAFFALWVVALKPGGSSSNGGSQGLGQYQSAINKAHQAVQTSNAGNAASGNDGTSSSAATSASRGASASSSTSSSTGSHSSSATTHAASGSHAARKPVVHLTPKVATHNHAALARLSTVQHALSAHKIVIMLFYNPKAADDQLVKQELSGVSSARNVVKLTIPLSESANFTPVTQQVPVNFSPTVVLIAPSGQAQEIAGLSDRFVIAQHVRDVAQASH
jgi:hypothetical protein